MGITENEHKLIDDILYITELHNNLNHEQQLNRLRDITQEEKFPILAIQGILDIKYSTAQSYFKKAKKSKAGNWMGNKIPIDNICKLCLHYNRSLLWFLDSSM